MLPYSTRNVQKAPEIRPFLHLALLHCSSYVPSSPTQSVGLSVGLERQAPWES
jgi:hypothetical protein